MPVIPPPLAADPVAQRTRWDPLARGGASFRTRNLVMVSPERIDFRVSLGAMVFGGVFAVMGLVPAAIGIAALHWVPLLFGLGFTGLAGALLYVSTGPVVFDRRAGVFRRGRAVWYETLNRIDPQEQAALDDVHALQILGERVRASKGSFLSYELNLVLRDGRRINVVDHGDYATLRRDADALSRFLGRPLWDTVADADST